jgi:hypothetical protein
MHVRVACAQAELQHQITSQLSAHKLAKSGTPAPSALRHILGMRAEGLGEAHTHACMCALVRANTHGHTCKDPSRARNTRAQIMMTPITFKEDASDNPNKGLGILKG